MTTAGIFALAACVVGFFAIGSLALWPRLPRRLLQHPALYALAFYGVSGVLFFYGAIELAGRYGLGGLLALLMYTTLFIFYPLFFEPLHWLSRSQALSTLPDLLVYRFRTTRIGQASTLVLATASLPIAAAQIRTITDTLLGTGSRSHSGFWWLVAGLGTALIVFVRLFGSAQRAPRAIPLVVASGAVLALVALTASGLVAVYGGFGSFSALNDWAMTSGQAATIQRFDMLYALSLLFFTAPLLQPQLFYTQTMGQWWPRNTPTAWMIPLVMLLATLPVFPVLWAGLHLELNAPFQYYLLAIPTTLDQPAVAFLVFLAGLFMGAGLLAVTAIAIGKITLHSLVTPPRQQFRTLRFEAWLNNWRFVASALWIVLACTFAGLAHSNSITDLTLAGMIGTVQLLPALVATLYLPRINHKGCMAGLTAGLALWGFACLLPLVTGVNEVVTVFGSQLMLGPSNWSYWLLESVIANLVVTLLVSWLTRMPRDEKQHASQTMVDSLPMPRRASLDNTSAREVEQALAQEIGQQPARAEVNRALLQLNMQEDDTRPLALRQFRDQLSYELSEKLGTHAAERIINQVMPLSRSGPSPVDDVSLLENRLANMGGALSGLAAELNKLRLFHRSTLENLPIGVCTIDQAGEIQLWNHTLATSTGISSHLAEGANLADLPPPWCDLLRGFADSDSGSWPTAEVNRGAGYEDKAWFHLYKYRVDDTSPINAGSQILLVEDISERLRLVQELAHSERLTSVGRLAAGVAHEIGNPVTGISCLAQDLESLSDDAETLATAAMIREQTERISRIVRTLIDFSRSDSGADHGPTDLGKVVDDAIQLLSLDRTARPVQFSASIPAGTRVYGDPNQLTQVFVNLLSNARDASNDDGLIRVYCAPGNGNTLRVRVEDEGSGIPGDIVDRVMDPFFTTKDPGKGTGLGLSLVFSIIRLHGGSVQIESPVSGNCGTRVSVTLKTPHLILSAGLV